MGSVFNKPKAPDNTAQLKALEEEKAEAQRQAEEAQQELTAEEKAKARRRRGKASLIGTSETGLLGAKETLG